ncbi:MotE family protein [Pelagibius sp. Alg239-R121]|uniref:MotE family protein n=1 Tax=Pelagibius sp. Alg239-R121 TaxID=2993448 RepID=UPI0024A6FDA0|nr:MotE family protein [Pelagibius sp. Alg239-R121]
MRLRLLPFLILAAAALFTVKIGNIWQGVSSATAAKAGLVQLAANPPAEEAAGQDQAEGDDSYVEDAKEGASPENSADTENVAEKSDGHAADEDDANGQGEGAEQQLAASQPKGATQQDPFSLTDEEIDLLQSLSERREAIELQARTLDQREILLKAAESRIDEKVAELEALRKSIEELLGEHDEETEAQMKSLVKIYEAMKPKDAARIFEQLDMVVLLEVIERMKERKTAPILANMDPERAKTITLELAQRRTLPIAKE